jgi:PEP-CTERM motif-containing protein
MKKLLACTLVAAAAYGSTAFAIPTLQLGIKDGVYDTTTQTVVATTNPFQLSAYLRPDNGGANTIGDTYYLSFAVIPNTTVSGSYGSFTINGTPINVTSDMVFGTPPLDVWDANQSDPGDLPGHGIFDTWFGQLAFQFDAGNQAAPFNTATHPTWDSTNSPGTGMYFENFTIDVSGLDPSLTIHFDLYNTELCGGTAGQCNIAGDIDQTQFAPFSHDAQSGSTSTTTSTTSSGASGTAPEPGTLSLLGGAILAGLFRYRRSQQARV